MYSPSERLQNIIAQGWVGMLFMLILMMLADLVELGMKGDFSPLAQDPGIAGLWFIVIVSSINVMMQISVRAYEDKLCRWSIFGVTALYTFVFIVHQATHLVAGEGFDLHFILDVTHHTIGIVTSIAAYRWAKLSERNGMVAPG